MFTLTDTKSPACHGTSFPTLLDAINYAYQLRQLGMCRNFSVGQYRDGKVEEVYSETSEPKCKDVHDIT